MIYQLLTIEPCLDIQNSQVIIEFHLASAISLRDYAYSQDFKQSLVVMPGKFMITNPPVLRLPNLYGVTLQQV